MKLSPPTPSRGRRPRRRLGAVVVTAAAALGCLTACGADADEPKLSLTAPLPTSVPEGTVIRIGDPAVQVALKASGLDRELTDAGVKVKWANISGGPDSIEAFRADKLDCSSVADVPSLFAHWTGTDTKIIFNSVTVDPLKYPTYQLGIAPGSDIKSLSDLRGKKIAYAAGQAQGALVLRILKKAGLTKDDVDLVNLPSTGTVYAQALGGRQVDAAPLGRATIQSTYLSQYPGATAIDTGIRDDAATVYCLTKAVQDPAKAAALAVYVKVRTEALLWQNEHREEWKKAYYEEDQGLTPELAQAAVDAAGTKGIPATWDNAIARLQETADLLAPEQGYEKFDVHEVVDTRFAEIEAKAAGDKVVTGDAS